MTEMQSMRPFQIPGASIGYSIIMTEDARCTVSCNPALDSEVGRMYFRTGAQGGTPLNRVLPQLSPR